MPHYGLHNLRIPICPGPKSVVFSRGNVHRRLYLPPLTPLHPEVYISPTTSCTIVYTRGTGFTTHRAIPFPSPITHSACSTRIAQQLHVPLSPLPPIYECLLYPSALRFLDTYKARQRPILSCPSTQYFKQYIISKGVA